MRRLSFGVRLALLNAAVVAAAMAILGTILIAFVDRSLRRGAEGILRDEMEEVATALRQESLDPEAVAEILRHEIGEHRSEALAFRITRAQGGEVARSDSPLWASVPSPAPGAPGVPPGRTVLPHGDAVRHRVLSRRVPTDSFGPVILDAGIRLRSADAALEELREATLILVPSLLLVALVAGYFLSRRALLPIGRMEEAARRIGTGAPGERLPRSGTGDEIDRLAGTLNGMVARIEEASARNLRFAGDVAHEVRTPLATIRARLEAIEGGGERVESAVAEVDRLEAMVRSLHHICRADEGASAGERAVVDLADEVREVTGFFAPAAAARGVHLTAEAPDPLHASIDRAAIRLAAANLVDNALHASDPGGEILLRGVRAGDAVRIEVLDRGVGVPAECRDRLFERFFRVPAGRARNAAGSGLGLSLVRAVARSHGGDAVYAPREGGGSVFRIELPSAGDAGSIPRSTPREDSPCHDAR